MVDPFFRFFSGRFFEKAGRRTRWEDDKKSGKELMVLPLGIEEFTLPVAIPPLYLILVEFLSPLLWLVSQVGR